MEEWLRLKTYEFRGWRYHLLHDRSCYGCHSTAIDAKAMAQGTGSVSGKKIVIEDGYIQHAALAERK